MARILLVEDQPFIANVYALLLKSGGHDVMVIHDGVLALAAVQSETFDVLITDIALSEMNGLELVRAVRKRGHAVAIVLTAGISSGPDADMMIAAEAGAFETLFKPVTRDQLIGAVAGALQYKHKREIGHRGEKLPSGT